MATIFRNSFSKLFFPALLIVGSATGITYLQDQTIPKTQATLTTEQYQQSQKEQQVFLDLMARTPNLGFGNVFANSIFLNFVQYFGDTAARNQTGYELSSEYFRAIVERDPRFVMAYSLLDPATTLFAGQAAESVEVMTQGLKSLTPEIKDAYLVWTYKGIDELLFLGKGKEAQKSYETASEWALKQNDETSRILGKRFAEMAEFLKENKNSKQAEAGSWLMVLSNAKDKKTVQIAIDKIRALGGQVIIEGNRVSVNFPKKD